MRDLSLRHKLIGTIMFICVIALALAGATFTAWEWTSLRRAMVIDLTTHADILADGCKAAITFEDSADANEILMTIGAVPSVQIACVFTSDGARFATYMRMDTAAPLPDPARLPEHHRFAGNFLTVVRPIMLEAAQIGTICITSSLDPLYARLKVSLAVTASILLVSALGAYLAALRFQRVISSPILYLAGVAHVVSEKKQYDVRADQHSSDEVGLLIQAFNEMLEQIQQRDSALVDANEQLEARVQERTAALSTANENLTREITFRKRAEQILKQRTERIMHHQRTLVELSKCANDDLDTALQTMTEEAAKTLATERVSIWFLNDRATALVCRDLYTRSDGVRENGMQLRAADYPSYFRAIENSRIVAANTAQEDPRTREFTRNHLKPKNIVSILDVPVRLHGKLLGVICCEHVGPPREWSLEEQDFAASLADMIALHMEASQRRKAETVRELRRSNKELQDFAYVTAHDLKAPLRGIGTLADWITSDYGDKLDDQGKEQLNLLKGRVSRMSGLIDGILHYSEIGRTAKGRERVDVNTLLPEIVTQLAPPQNIVVTIDKNLPTVVFERVRLLQIFQNLIGNAIKYMDKPQGYIHIGCSSQGQFWRFTVSDNGPGIDEKYFKKIFKMFQTLTRRDDLESTGIGLAVVKKIVELHGGTVAVKSKVGEETTFAFTVPKQDAPTQAGQDDLGTSQAPSVSARASE
jgi:signal transduction histidine kinase